jgi:hypothetical protein
VPKAQSSSFSPPGLNAVGEPTDRENFLYDLKAARRAATAAASATSPALPPRRARRRSAGAKSDVSSGRLTRRSGSQRLGGWLP